MAERIGLLLKAFDNGTAEVMADKKSACGGCQDTRNCKSCLSASDKIVAIVQNDACARPGDVVQIEHKRDALLGSAALFYGVPVIGLLVGAFIGRAIAAGLAMDESVGAVIAGLAGLVIGLLAVVWFSRTEFARLRLVPHIIGIVKNGSNERDHTGTKAGPQVSNRSCCG